MKQLKLFYPSAKTNNIQKIVEVILWLNGCAALSAEINKVTDTGRYRVKKLSSLLSEVQTGKFD